MWIGPPYCETTNGTKDLVNRIRKIQQTQKEWTRINNSQIIYFEESHDFSSIYCDVMYLKITGSWHNMLSIIPDNLTEPVGF